MVIECSPCLTDLSSGIIFEDSDELFDIEEYDSCFICIPRGSGTGFLGWVFVPLPSLISVREFSQVFELYQKVVPDSISTNKENLLVEVWDPHQIATQNIKLDRVPILTCVSHQVEVEVVAILQVEMALSIVIINTVNQ